MVINQKKISWLDRPIFSFLPPLTGEMTVFSLIILIACFSRLYDLGARVFSHDENLHVYFSWLFSIGKGYQHTPLMHGPLQFHLLALTFQLFGASDFTARLPHALASILTIILLWKWRRYLGRAGTLVAAGLMLISPYMLYYGRYARNEAFIGVFFVLTLYAILRYLETGKKRYLVLLTIATVLHFTSKETAFIYTAQALLFLAIFLINRVVRLPWKNTKILSAFLAVLCLGVLLAGGALGVTIYNRVQAKTDASQTAAPIIPGLIPGVTSSLARQIPPASFLILLTGCAFLFGAILMVIGYGWKNLRKERAFDMLILLGTFVLPQLAAFPVSALGWNPLDYQFRWPGLNFSALWAQTPFRTLVVLIILWVATITIGLFWNKKFWILYAVLFWGIYITFYTSIFTYWQGFFTGTVGSLGYWLQQQGVHRGDQPWYYYLLIQVPIYESLPAIGISLAAYFGLRHKYPAVVLSSEKVGREEEESNGYAHSNEYDTEKKNSGDLFFALLIWWSLTSLLAYTLAGEKMPWLTVHITLPMILLTAWGLGQVIERMDWEAFRKKNGVSITILLTILLTSLVGIFVKALGAHPPFQGKTLEQLNSTGSFLLVLFLALICGTGLYFLFKSWTRGNGLRIAILVFFGLLAVLTIRTAYRAAFITPNDATEYLVYAHGAGGIKDVMNQITKISSTIAGEQDLQVAYDNNLPNQGVSWSFKWYLRNYHNAVTFDKPDNTLQGKPVIIVDQENFERIKPIVGNNYYQFNYIRMVWPNQDYFGLSWPRIKGALTNPSMRDAIFQIWLNRDYSEYAQITGNKGLTVADWQPNARMELFVRKDIAAQMWEYSIPYTAPLQVDPYEKGTISLTPDEIIGAASGSETQLNTPRGLAIAPDGSIYVADSHNNRIVHFDAAGNILQTIGQTSPGCPYASVPPANLALGTFCEPWSVAVSPDGQSIYVADTWNHRIQKLSADGKPIKAWGTPNYDPVSSTSYGLWGPRGITVDAKGNVIVVDTGNKRIAIYNSNGDFITQFGGGGTGPGQFDEPVGVALDSQGNLYVADTWNQRVQIFKPNAEKPGYTPSNQWNLSAWSSQTLDNKPFLVVDKQGNVFVTDADSFRVLEFSNKGDFVLAWGGFGSAANNFGMPSGIVMDDQGKIWVSDAANNRLMQFTLP